MPLHLLGKKSWNVYNRDNIARVRRDEEEAAARETAAEQTLQDANAHRRITSLRGETPGDDVFLSREDLKGPRSGHDNISQYLGKSSARENCNHRRKRRRGENDTDRDIRYAMQTTDEHISRRGKLMPKSRSGRKLENAPIVDHNGNINLFNTEGQISDDTIRMGSLNYAGDAPAVLPRVSEEFDGIVGLADVRGHRRQAEQRVWQRSPPKTSENFMQGAATDAVARCSEDIKRLQRNRIQRAADDPLIAMNRGIQQVRRVECDRRKWKEKRLAEIENTSADKDRALSSTSYYQKDLR